MWRFLKIPKAVALLAFALPWMTVSCSSTVLVKASGWAITSGRITVQNPITGVAQVQDGRVDWWLVAALVAIVVGLVATLGERRRGALVVTVTSVLALLFVLAGTHRYSTDALAAEMHKTRPSETDGGMGDRMAKAIHVDWQIGYWIEVAALLAAAGMAGMVVAGRDVAGRRDDLPG